LRYTAIVAAVAPIAKVTVPEAPTKSLLAVALPSTVVQLTDVAASAGAFSVSVTLTRV
jgi:hypothetical protein